MFDDWRNSLRVESKPYSKFQTPHGTSKLAPGHALLVASSPNIRHDDQAFHGQAVVLCKAGNEFEEKLQSRETRIGSCTFMAVCMGTGHGKLLLSSCETPTQSGCQ